MFKSLTPESFTPRGVVKLGFDVMRQSAGIGRLFLPWSEGHRALLEFRNKLEACESFAHVDSMLSIPAHQDVPLHELVSRTEYLEPYRAVWSTEGLGYYILVKSWSRRQMPRNLLRSNDIQQVPEKSMTALHSGMGLAIADLILRTISRRSPESEIRQALDQFVLVCRDNSRPGYTGIALESLGLLTQNLHPHMISMLDHQLGMIDEDLRAYFWHGIGRGLYFAPTSFLTDGNSERALRMISQKPAHELGRRNALAGLVWAMTLINIRHPEILANFLKHHTGQLDHDAFVNGVTSSLLIWHDSTVGDPSVRAFYEYHSDVDGALTQCWEQMVRRPCIEKLESVYPVLKSQGRLEEVFRCHAPLVG